MRIDYQNRESGARATFKEEEREKMKKIIEN